MESLNPFDDENAVCCVLINDEQQYSLWPEALTAPAGWRVVFGPSAHRDCNHWLEEHWRDMRPHSLRLHDAASFEQESTGV
ncbi:MbtH family protein [Ewingella americana]|uniref:MbtH family protein n=1 Tax=Ewingella americana TaxID=41202 RepID=A0A502GQ88_9GAMM|nr:MbtH family NRPS accessory protein [Ewingella americana]TPG63156.1 MbtH family protein [Ewingella americana]